MNKAGTTNPAVFTPMAVLAMNRAYDQACDIIKAAGAGQDVRIKVGEHIMFLARNGETDERRMCGLAIQEALGCDVSVNRDEPASEKSIGSWVLPREHSH